MLPTLKPLSDWPVSSRVPPVSAPLLWDYKRPPPHLTLVVLVNDLFQLYFMCASVRLYMCECLSACMDVHHRHTWYLWRLLGSLDLKLEMLRATMWVLGVESRFLKEKPSGLKC